MVPKMAKLRKGSDIIMKNIDSKNSNKMPPFDQLMNPLFQALKELGGSGTIDEINQKVFDNEHLPDKILEVPHGDKGGQTEVEYRLAWARTYLKIYGVLENSSRGVWALTSSALNINKINSQDVLKKVREENSKKRNKNKKVENDEQLIGDDIDEQEDLDFWKSRLRKILGEMDPDAFERLVQRILRESGFTQVEVTGRSGDGGIDGKGIARINGFLSFHVLFQCKRYNGTVSTGHIRDFRGAMQGRADKGLFMTTGSFTKDATREAIRDGAPPIDLIDGDQLVEKLRELNLGLKKEVIEKITIEEDWFKGI
jgi:restriction system protein